MEIIAALGNTFGAPCRQLHSFGPGITLVQLGDIKGVVKEHPNAGIEAAMLHYLNPHLCVPQVLDSGNGYVLMEYLEQSGRLDEEQAARGSCRAPCRKSRVVRAAF